MQGTPWDLSAQLQWVEQWMPGHLSLRCTLVELWAPWGPQFAMDALWTSVVMHIGRAMGALGPRLAMHVGRALGAVGAQFADARWSSSGHLELNMQCPTLGQWAPWDPSEQAMHKGRVRYSKGSKAGSGKRPPSPLATC